MVMWIVGILTVAAFWKTKAKEACFDYPLTESCEALNGVREAIVDVEWRLFDPISVPQWIPLGYCNEHMNCKVIKNRKRLPNGIKVLNITENGTLRILQGSVNNNTNLTQSRLQCQVHYVDGNSTVKSHEVNIKFTACTCEWVMEGRNVNLTRILLKLVSCEHVGDVEWYTNDSQFAYCNSCQLCIQTNPNSEHQVSLDFRKRLRFTRGLILSKIQGYDDRREISVRVHIKTDSGAETARSFTIRIFVKKSRDSPPVPATVITILALPSASRTIAGTAESNTGPSTKPLSPTGIINKSAATNSSQSTPVLTKSGSSAIHRLAWTVVLIVVNFVFCVR